MKKEIRTVTKDGIVQITTVDERWYARPTTDPVTGLPATYDFVPSVTWISSFYPKGYGFMKWLASTGWDEAEAIKQTAGDKGSKVHQAVADLVDGKTVGMQAEYLNPSTGQPEELIVQEYECLLAFKAWWAHAKPTLIWRDVVLWNETENYAGTADLLVGAADGVWLIDVKTGQYVWPEHELQVSAYKHALPVDVDASTVKLAILQVGYRANKRGWKLTEVEDQFELFLAAKQIWAKETEGQTVRQRDYPLAVSLNGLGEAPATPPMDTMLGQPITKAERERISKDGP